MLMADHRYPRAAVKTHRIVTIKSFASNVFVFGWMATTEVVGWAVAWWSVYSRRKQSNDRECPLIKTTNIETNVN